MLAEYGDLVTRRRRQPTIVHGVMFLIIITPIKPKAEYAEAISMEQS